MSDIPVTEDPLLGHLRARQRELEQEIRDRQAVLTEIDRLIIVATDGRSRVNRKRRGTGTNSAPPATQPGGYDDSVSIDDVRGIMPTAVDGEAA
jgi:hypothetical protein